MLRTLFTAVLVAVVLIGVAPSAMAAPTQTATAQQAPPPAPPTPTPASAPTNLNTATVAQLEALPGIGPAIAARIVEYRDKNGAFKRVEDLMNVRGVGEKTFLSIKPLITVTPPKGGAW